MPTNYWATVLDRKGAVAILLTGVWVLAIVVVDPRGEFPLNDDWAYAWSVKTLLLEGRFELSDWTATNLLPQVFWGWLFCLPEGFSFTALRLSTLVAAFLSLFALLGFFRATRARTTVLVTGVLAIALNPLFFSLSHSFNSDVPSFALFACACYAIARGLQGSRAFLLLAVFLSIIAILERQANLVLLPALGAAYLATVRVTARSLVLSSIIALTGIAVQSGYEHWLTVSARRPLLYGFQVDKLIETFGRGLAAVAYLYWTNFLVIAAYLGLLLLPVLMLVYSIHLKGLSTRQRSASLAYVVTCVVGGLLLLGDRRLPSIGNVLDTAGVGPQAVGGFYDTLGASRLAVVTELWNDLTALGLAGAAILLACIVRTLRRSWRSSEHAEAERGLVVFAASTLFLLFISVGGLPQELWFDRYLLPFLPVSVLLAVLSVSPHDRHVAAGRTAVVLSATSLVVFATFSVASTHDLLASNRARWVAYDELLRNSPALLADIDDWDFVGWHFAQRIDICNPGYDRLSSHAATWDDFTCLSASRNRTLVTSYQALPGHHIVLSRSYRRWLPLTIDTVFVLRRP